MEEALTLQQRIKRSRMMKVKSKMIARKREIAMRKRASTDKLKQRASKAARKIIQNKILKNRDKDELSFVSREKLFKKMFGYYDKGVFNMMTNKFKKIFEDMDMEFKPKSMHYIVSILSAGLKIFKFGIDLNPDSCSTGWWVGPSSPKPIES